MIMYNYARFDLIGNITRDPESRTFSSGTTKVSFGVAVNKRVKSGDEWVNKPNFFDCEAWSKIAEFIQAKLHKGSKVRLAGELEFQQWEQDGQKRSKVVLVVFDITPLDDSRNQGQDSGYQQAPPQQRQQQAPQRQQRPVRQPRQDDGWDAPGGQDDFNDPGQYDQIPF